MIPRVKEGDRLSAAKRNRLIDKVNRLSRIVPPVLPAGFPEGRIEPFQLTSTLTYPAGTNICPYATAKPVGYLASTDRYGYTDYQSNQTVYHPMALRDAAGDYIDIPIMRIGDRVWVALNHQSGRLEIVWATSQTTWRGKLDGPLAQGGSATVSIWIWNGSDADSTVNVTAYDWLLLPGDSLASGKKVVIKWFRDDGRFWVMGVEC